MSVFDLTPPAAFLSAIKAANDKDRQNARLLLEQRVGAQPEKRNARITTEPGLQDHQRITPAHRHAI